MSSARTLKFRHYAAVEFPAMIILSVQLSINTIFIIRTNKFSFANYVYLYKQVIVMINYYIYTEAVDGVSTIRDLSTMIFYRFTCVSRQLLLFN